MPTRVGLVANPSARGDVTSALEAACAMVEQAGAISEKRRTEAPGHAYLLAQELVSAGADLVVALGGDGTVREVAGALAGGEVPMAIVPAGTGNSSYLELYGDASWEQELAAILRRAVVGRVDLIEITPGGGYSLLGFSAGWFAQIVELAATVAAAGPARYVEALGIAAATPARFTATVRVDGEPLADGELGLLAIGGARVRASVFPVFPDSRMDDGLLEVLAVRATDTAGFNSLVGAVMEGRHLAHPLAAYRRARTVEVTAPGGLKAEIDGDLWTPELFALTAVCAPAALPVAFGAK